MQDNTPTSDQCLSYRCPRCAAEPGQVCRTRGGREAEYPHTKTAPRRWRGAATSVAASVTHTCFVLRMRKPANCELRLQQERRQLHR
jgi:hypothetical protein